jgi:serine phosphatase RsbU (regulator of sigma subunit)
MAVREALAGLKGLLSPLHLESARLSAEIAHSGYSEDLVPRIICLGVEVSQAAALFDAAVATLQARQQSLSQVVDLSRSLGQLKRSIPRLPTA